MRAMYQLLGFFIFVLTPSLFVGLVTSFIDPKLGVILGLAFMCFSISLCYGKCPSDRKS